MSKIKVTYMSGAGNLFSVVDDRENKYDFEFLKKLAPKITSKKKLAIFDTEGLMVLRNSKKFDFECIFFNPDGSTGMMCGNGGRAITRFYQVKVGETAKDYEFLMAGDIYSASINGDLIDLTLPDIKKYQKVNIELNNKEYVFDYIFNGSDHCVVNTTIIGIQLDALKINEYGKAIRHNKAFGNTGANANFFEIKDNKVYLRTYERGVEKETGACGTGAIATAYSTVKNNLMEFPVKIIPSSGELIIVDYDENKKIMHLIGPAVILEEDEIEIENDRN